MKNQRARVDALIAECDDNPGQSTDKNLERAKEALELSTSIQYDLGIFEGHFRIARCMMSKGENEEAIQHLDICYSIAITLDDKVRIARTENFFGIAYYNLGVTSKSLEHLLQALDISKSDNYPEIECWVYNNICSILAELGDYETALSYLYTLLEIVLKNPDSQFPLCVVYRNLAFTLHCMNEITEAESYAINSLELALKNENVQIVCESYYILGEIRFGQNNKTEANDYYLKALSIAEHVSNNYYIALIYSKLSKLYCAMGSHDTAFDTALYAYNYVMKLDYPILKRNIALILAEICRIKNNTKMLIESLMAYKGITQTLENENLHRQQTFIKAQLMLFNLQKDNERLRIEIERDPLTGCLSGRTFPDRITKALSVCGNKGALIFLDVDNLKNVNDSYGHDAGDDLLKGFAKDLMDSLPKEALKIRLSGDEFIVFLPKAGKAEATRNLDKLMTSLSRPHKIGGLFLPITVSAGVALCPDHSTDIRRLKKMADEAMYVAKQSGRGGYKVYNMSS